MVDSAILSNSSKLPPGAVLPNYKGGSILNLLASVGLALQGETVWPEAELLPASRLGRRQVLLVVDGLGYLQLNSTVAGGFLEQHCLGALTSVVPSATAAAIPVYLTGEPPLRHGFSGWFSWFRELSMVIAILPFVSRAGFQSLADNVTSPKQLSQVAAFSEKLKVPSWHISPHTIAFSRFSKDFQGAAAILPYQDLRDMQKQIVQAVSQFDPGGYAYVYWPHYDHMAHQYGVYSPQAIQHLQMLDCELEGLARSLKGQDVDLIICSDHGFTDCPPQRQLTFVEQFPELAEMTIMPLTGEPRLAFAHLKNAKVDTFLKAAGEQLSGIATPVLSQELIDAGVFGTGRQHVQFKDRVGDVVLLMHENTVLFDPLPGESPPQLIGHHGGLSADEMLVPLIRIAC